MKKLLTILAILICSLGYSQDIATIKSQINNLDSLRVRSLSDSIAYMARRDFIFRSYKTTHQKSTVVLQYIPKDLTEEEQRKLKYGCNSCIILYFEGSNDLYTLKDVVGMYQDVFPTWQHYFVNKATKEGVRNYENRDIYEGNRGLFRITRANEYSDKSWRIRNNSN